MRVLSFPLEHIDKYYQKKFMFDMSHYFEIEGRNFIPRGTFPEMTEKNVIRKLYKRGQLAIDGSPAVYMGAGPWYSTEQNFEFCGMFIYMWLVDKCLRKLYGKDDALLFCKTFCWPIIKSVQPDEDFDLVATLKEAGLAPAKAECENYLTMLDAVLPYMQEKTKEFLIPYGDKLKSEYDAHIHSLKEWIRNTEDEIVSYYGLRLRKEKMSPNQWPLNRYRYYSLESLSKFSNTHKVFSFDDIAKLNLPEAPFTFADITRLDGPVIPHYSDLEVMPIKFEDKSLLHVVPMYDEKYEKNGRKGEKDCWGRVIVPAIFDDCQSCTLMGEQHTDKACVAIKKDGKWGLIKRNDYNNVIFPLIYDRIVSFFNGDFMVQIADKYGLINLEGTVRLHIEMDDIYSLSFNNVIPYKKNGKFGFLLEDGSMTKPIFDAYDERDGLLHELVCLNGKWGYLDKELQFTTKRSQAALGSGLAICHSYNPHSKLSDEEEMSLFSDWNSGIDKGVSFWMEEINNNKGRVQFEIRIDQPILYFSMSYSEEVLAIDLRQPYLLKLADKGERFSKSWDGYENEKEFIKQWLNRKNEKTMVRNWAEAVHTYNTWSIADEPTIDYCYSKNKAIAYADIRDMDIEDVDFPELEY